MWLFLAVFVGACIVGSWLGLLFELSQITSIAVSGWLLEISGVLAVAKGLANKLDLYGGVGIGERIVG